MTSQLPQRGGGRLRILPQPLQTPERASSTLSGEVIIRSVPQLMEQRDRITHCHGGQSAVGNRAQRVTGAAGVLDQFEYPVVQAGLADRLAFACGRTADLGGQ